MEKILSELDGHVQTVTLNRPEAHNALDMDMIQGLTKTFKAISRDEKVRAVLLRGAGPSFCSGGDLNWMKQAIKFNLAQNKKDALKLSEMYESIFRCAVPVIGIAHGNVFGGGVGFASVCDLLVAERETKFCLSEVKLGLVPAVISPYVLRKMPEAIAKMYMLTAEVFSAQKALEAGLAHYIGTKDEIEHFAVGKAKTLANNAPEAVRQTKALIHKVKLSTWAQSRKLSIDTISKKRVSPEGQEGMAAFFEKRKPNWVDQN